MATPHRFTHLDYVIVVSTVLFLTGFFARAYIEWRIRNEPWPWRRSSGVSVVTFPKERTYWALVKQKKARAWPILLSYFGIAGGLLIFIIGSTLLKR